MTPEAQRIAIAKACPSLFMVGESVFRRPQIFWLDGCHQGPSVDPLNDLNAMHEAEKVLTGKGQQATFAQRLIEVLNEERRGEPRFLGPSQFDQTHATAAQRAEAFLKTLGLWEEA